MLNKVTKIVSGGQTGADRAALDFALANGIAIGGFVPKGRIAENGTIPLKYPGLTETETSDPEERTKLNVIYSDATLIISNGHLTGGSKLTKKLALENKKPALCIDLQNHDIRYAVETTSKWLGRWRARS